MREYCTRVPAHVIHRNNRERYMYRSLICKLMVSRQSGLGLRLLISFPSDKDVYITCQGMFTDTRVQFSLSLI